MAIVAKGLEYIAAKRMATNVLPCKQVVNMFGGGYYATR
jgi:hypothetical protein